MAYLQTLDRGVRILQLLAASEDSMTIQEVAEALGVHRSIAYRILRTFEAHRLVERETGNRYAPGVGLAALASTVKRDLQNAALPEMNDVASELAMTVFLAVPDQGQAVTGASAEPRHSRVHVAYRPGIRHPIDQGAPGLALLSGGSPKPTERPEVAVARERGWASSHQEVLRGMRSIATVIRGGLDSPVAALAVVYVDPNAGTHRIGERLVVAARAIEAELSC